MKLKLVEIRDIPRPKYELLVDSYEGDSERRKTTRWAFDGLPPLQALLERLTPQIGNVEGEFYTEDADIQTMIISIVGLNDGDLVRVLDAIRVVENCYESGISKMYVAEKE